MGRYVWSIVGVFGVEAKAAIFTSGMAASRHA